MNVERVTAHITAENLPAGLWWETDGACWEAVRSDPLTTGIYWRWQPKNEKALAKEGPQGEMTPFALPERL